MIIIHPFPRPVKLSYVFMIWNCFFPFSRVGFSSFERENASNKGGARTGALDRAKCPEHGNAVPLLRALPQKVSSLGKTSLRYFLGLRPVPMLAGIKRPLCLRTLRISVVRAPLLPLNRNEQNADIRMKGAKSALTRARGALPRKIACGDICGGPEGALCQMLCEFKAALTQLFAEQRRDHSLSLK